MQKKNQEKIVKCSFEINLPHAKEVKLCGTFNNWEHNGFPLKKKQGIWTVILGLKPGKYEYKFLADGVWHTDPKAEKTHNSFGTENSVIIVK